MSFDKHFNEDSEVSFCNPVSTICSGCDDQSEAKFKCIECEDTLCNLCHQAHLKVRLTRNHTIIALPREDEQMEASAISSSSSSLPPGQMEYMLRGKTSALMSSSDSD